ncbi:arginine repressor, ArgR [Melioribacter roseus P3M-2]|uniref:Arginine repressor n=1 Tax=Melioribacter roseus (strain DSM 23840 / JCM 17771 / VKM B-2668 / P3M-2) TaxID=1191523 RepID=I6ZQ14_MELRP|nr:arginine repressor [Melioribacter roseus]AFN74159.1 arginine repressor, ArgR [Melioribacter roseus P3M-2]
MGKKLEEIQKRHSLIKSIITSQEVFNQTQLGKLLKSKGIKVTQATLSRDLNELGVVRVPTSKGLVYQINQEGGEGALKNYIAEEVLAIESNECLILVKTFLGRAQGVAVQIDRENLPDVLGTIAGDDTIIVVPKSTKNIKKVIEELKTLLGIEK